MMFLSATLFGPIFGLILISIHLARLRFSGVQILYELTEPMLALLAAVLAVAICGIWLQIAG